MRVPSIRLKTFILHERGNGFILPTKIFISIYRFKFFSIRKPLKTLRLFSPLLDPFLPLDRIEFIGRPEQARAYRTGSPRTYVLISRWHRRNSVYTDTGHFLASPRRSRNERERDWYARVFEACVSQKRRISFDRSNDRRLRSILFHLFARRCFRKKSRNDRFCLPIFFFFFWNERDFVDLLLR